MNKRNIWIDTDAGTDDAVALIMAMKHDHINIVGISTSGGNVPLDCVVQNVLYIRDLCHNSSPVYVGAAQPLQRTLGTADFIHGKDGLGDIGLVLQGRIPDDGEAHIQLLKALGTYDDLEVVCLGPLTNIALTEQAEEGSLSKAKTIYVMGGLVELPGNVTPLAEYNIWADPEAAQIVLHQLDNVIMIGWDTTLLSAPMYAADIEDIRKIGTPLSAFAMDIQQVRLAWMEEHQEETSILLADALAMAVVILPHSISKQASYSMEVLSGQEDETKRGYIVCEASDQPTSVTHVSEVDKDLYFQLIRDSLSS